MFIAVCMLLGDIFVLIVDYREANQSWEQVEELERRPIIPRVVVTRV